MAYTLRDDQFWPTGGVVAGHSSWRSDRAEAGGGALLEHSIHSCDILGWLFGPVERVYATTRNMFGYSVEDVAALTIEHRNGVVGNLVTVFNGVQHRRNGASRCSSSRHRSSSQPISWSVRRKTRSSCIGPTNNTPSATTSMQLQQGIVCG